MRTHTRVWLLISILASSAVAILAGGSFNTQSQDYGQFPIADYSSTLPVDAKERARRQARNKRYDLPSEIKSEDVGRFMLKESDPEVSVPLSPSHPPIKPAIPAADSDAIVIGEVVTARAYLSNDKTRVYSEFTARVSDILKDSRPGTLLTGAQIDVERAGGRVRLPSGKVLVRGAAYGENMPRVGRRYLLFLRWNDEGEDYSIITSYELNSGQVFPLDRSPAGSGKSEQFAEYEKYAGRDEASFLNDVFTAIAAATQK